jgi:hypothetical protein
MAILLTMQVGPVDWAKFKAAVDWGKGAPAPGRRYSRVYRAEGDGSKVLILEEWESHDHMHRYQEQVGEEFNRRAGTEGLGWQDQVWTLADSLQD